MRQGRSLALLIVLLTSLILPSTLLAQRVDVLFHWAPSPAQDAAGLHAPPVYYEVYHQRNDGLVRLVGTAEDTNYSFQAERGIVHRIRVRGVDAQHRPGALSRWSDEVYFEVDIPHSTDNLPTAPRLNQNYPNPFNPETIISYGIPEGAGGNPRVALEIFNIRGRRVRVLPITTTEAGWYEVAWNGRDDNGRLQPTGQYIARFRCNDEVSTVKMTMVK